MTHVEIVHAHVIDGLRRLPAESVQMVVTSPPYWGLRAYNTPPQIWGGRDDCAHDFQPCGTRHRGGPAGKGEANDGRDRSALDAVGDIACGEICTKCGAWRGEHGLEPTPELYVEHEVMIFREVWRVLRDDGTLWLNLGDTYASGGLSGGGKQGERWKECGSKVTGPRGGYYRSPPPGLKPKDLCLIPARVALALQAPFYTGSILNECDRVWLAAMLDAEGCLFIHKRKAGQSNGQGYRRQNDTFSPGVEIANTSLAVIERIHRLVGKGSICSQGPAETGGRRKQTIYRWNLRTTECREFVTELYPHLVAKRHQARILIGCPSSGPEAEASHASLIALHRGLPATIDFPEPRSLFCPGWYVRSDVIWSKCNPMPESCSDRPTKSHEHILLLTKSQRYFYDNFAAREAVTGTANPRGNGVNPKCAGWQHGPGTHDTLKHAQPKDADQKFGAPTRDRRPSGWNQGEDRQHEETAGRYPRPKQNASFSAAVCDLVSDRNWRDVWTFTTEAFPEAHYATFPRELARRCIVAGTSEGGCCPKCGAPRERIIEKGAPKIEQQRACGGDANGEYDGQAHKDYTSHKAQDPSAVKARILAGMVEKKTVGWRYTCDCGGDAVPVPCTVLDIFGGSGTVGEVAESLGRNAILIELLEANIGLIKGRTQQPGLILHP
jgi:DNA modification methylase